MAGLIDVKDCPCDGCEAKPCGHPARCVKFALWLNKTVDAVEVVRGQWVSDKADILFHCSVCETQISTDWDYEDLSWNYCPNCGAKMDGERKDNG